MAGGGWVEDRQSQPYARETLMQMPVDNPPEPADPEVPRWKLGLPDLPRGSASREDSMPWEAVF